MSKAQGKKFKLLLEGLWFLRPIFTFDMNREGLGMVKITDGL